MSDPLEGRLWRFGQDDPNPALFLDTVLPGGARSIWSIIGQNVGEDRSVRPPIPADGFHLAIVQADPGNGSHLHDHTTVEVFLALSGTWAIPYADAPDGEVRELLLGPLDVLSVPPGVWRGFRNAGDGPGLLLAIVGGTDAGRLEWAPQVLEAARAAGRALDPDGYLPDA